MADADPDPASGGELSGDAFAATVADGVLCVSNPETRWLSTGWDGGRSRGDVAYNVSVPQGWERTDLRPYLDGRLADAGFEADGPALLTGVDLRHARGARAGPVVAYATVGLSNPAALPVGDDPPTTTDRGGDAPRSERSGHETGTVNLVVGTTRSLAAGALANLVAVVAEAKAATLLSLSGFPGTTSDAVVVGSAVDGEPAAFSGSATPVGSAARACVREAVTA
ncbi:adenosylcobinamide amidohydrolase, partial [Halobacteriales archaeon QS_6_71_20]